jgi:hypothetical protein
LAISSEKVTMSGNYVMVKHSETLEIISRKCPTYKLSLVDADDVVVECLVPELVEPVGGACGLQRLSVVRRDVLFVVSDVARVLYDEALVAGDLEPLQAADQLGRLAREHGAKDHLKREPEIR